MPHKPLKIFAALALSSCFSFAAFAGIENFHKGTVITDFGEVATIDADMVIPKNAKFKISFDTVKDAKPGEINKTFNTAARFLNMHAEAGVAKKNMKLAVVFHGKGSVDVTQASYYGVKYDGVENANAALVKALTENGVRVILCGQSAAYYDISNEDLLPGVEMALSAMTAHALLQQEGYTLNPF
ncbi:DsrE family protein [Hellea sp.]|nr:DsrE family protein [Hellea sp.]